MIIIRNPYVQVLGGIFWDIKASYDAPTQEGRPGDIRLVLPYPKGQPVLQDYIDAYLNSFRTITNDTSYPWKQVDNILQSTNHNHNTSSTYKLTFHAAGTLTFDYNVNSEGADPLIIKHNTTTLVNKGGTGNTYTSKTIVVAAGDTVEFTYRKDSSVDTGSDMAYIRDLLFTPEGGSMDIPESVYDEFNADWQAWREGLTLPDISDIEQVGIYTNLVDSDGNVFGENGIFLFSALNGTLGEAEAQLFNNRTVGIDINLSRSVVNIGGMQRVCDVYVWDVKTQMWVKAECQKLPVAKIEHLNITDWYTKGVDVSNVQIWSLLNPQETITELVNTGVHEFTENPDVASWYTPTDMPTTISIWALLSPVDGGTMTKNDNPIPF